MKKVKAVWYAFCVIVLYYVVRPVDCFVRASIESGLMNKHHFNNVFKHYWEMDYAYPEVHWEMIKELWNEGS